jgi:hypothetical protein
MPGQAHFSVQKPTAVLLERETGGKQKRKDFLAVRNHLSSDDTDTFN